MNRLRSIAFVYGIIDSVPADTAKNPPSGRCLRCGELFKRLPRTPNRKRFCSDSCRSKFHQGEEMDFQKMEVKLVAKLSKMLTRLKKDLRAELLAEIRKSS